MQAARNALDRDTDSRRDGGAQARQGQAWSDFPADLDSRHSRNSLTVLDRSVSADQVPDQPTKQERGLADQMAPQSIDRRTIQAELPGAGGGRWKREETRIQFIPWVDGWDDERLRGARGIMEQRRPPAHEKQTPDLHQLSEESSGRIFGSEEMIGMPNRELGRMEGEHGALDSMHFRQSFRGVAAQSVIKLLDSRRRRQRMGFAFRLW